MAGVEADHGPVAQRADVGVGGAPVRYVGVVERRLEELVLQHHPLVLAELGVDGGQSLGQPVLTRPHVALARVVRAVREPDLEVPRAGLAHHLDAVQVVLHRLAPYGGVGVGQAAQPVVVVLEGVAVDGAEPYAEVGGVAAQRGEVVDQVPRDVQGHRRSEPGEAVHRRRVGDLLLHGARRARAAEDLEAGARVAVGPRGHLDGQGTQLLADACERRHGGAISVGGGDGAAGTPAVGRRRSPSLYESVKSNKNATTAQPSARQISR